MCWLSFVASFKASWLSAEFLTFIANEKEYRLEKKFPSPPKKPNIIDSLGHDIQVSFLAENIWWHLSVP